MNIDTLFFVLEIVGTVAFAITGVLVAIEKQLDILGAVVMGLATAVGGGMIRDIILGYLPPVAFRKPVYSMVAIGVSVVVYFIFYFGGKKLTSRITEYSRFINILDAIGLGVFTIGGINSAHSCGFTDNAYLCIFVGVLTGVGGGVMRDIMAGKIPGILKKRIYALAALIGAFIYQMITEYGIMKSTPAILICASVIIVIRIFATIFHWNLPRIKNKEEKLKNEKNSQL